jgi:hypothetical protein
LLVILLAAKVIYDLWFEADPDLAGFIGGAVIAEAHLYGIAIALTHTGLQRLFLVWRKRRTNGQASDG